MDILIVSHFGSTYSENDNDRFLYLAKMLKDEYQVEIVTSSFCHEKKNHRKKTEYKWPFSVTFLDEIGYKKNICLKRFLSHFIWGINLRKYLKRRKKPDVIYCAVPSLTGPYFVSKYCKKNNVKFIIDVQDLWPEAFELVFNIPILSKIIYAPFNVVANHIYKRADSICAVSETYAERAMKNNKKCKNKNVVFLGTDLHLFDTCNEETSYKKNGKDEFWIAYCGTLGSSYDLTTVIKSLYLLKQRGEKEAKLIVIGDGPLMSKFENLANSLEINCEFTGRLPYNEMCSLLKKCDITVNPIMQGAAQSIINKHADYLASGLPMVSTQDNVEFNKLMDEYKFGIKCSNGNEKEIVSSILKLMHDDDLRVVLGKNARICAEEKFDRNTSYKLLTNAILNEDGGDGELQRNTK